MWGTKTRSECIHPLMAVDMDNHELDPLDLDEAIVEDQDQVRVYSPIDGG